MLKFLAYPLAAAIGYLVGSLNPAYFMGRLRGFDIRQTGSKNAGATNTVLSIGAVSGVLVMLLDILKMVLVLWCTEHMLPALPGILIVAGLAALLGHCYPFYLQFRGGKGMASYFGIVAYTLPPLAMAISFFVYWATSAIIYFVWKQKKHVTTIGPLIGIIYFWVFGTRPEYQWLGTAAGMTLCLCNLQKARAA